MSCFEICVSIVHVCFFLFVIDLQEANDSLKCLAEEQNPAHDSMTGTSESSACMLSILWVNNCRDNFYRRCTCMYTDEIFTRKTFCTVGPMQSNCNSFSGNSALQHTVAIVLLAAVAPILGFSGTLAVCDRSELRHDCVAVASEGTILPRPFHSHRRTCLLLLSFSRQSSHKLQAHLIWRFCIRHLLHLFVCFCDGLSWDSYREWSLGVW